MSIIQKVSLLITLLWLCLMTNDAINADNSVLGEAPCAINAPIRAVFSNDGQEIIVSTGDGMVYIFDHQLEELIASYKYPKPYSLGVSTSPFNDFIVAYDLSDITNNATTTVILDNEGQFIRQVNGSYGAIIGENLLLTNGNGAISRLWEIDTGIVRRELEEIFFNPIIAPNHRWLLRLPGPALGQIELWSLPELELVFTFPAIDLTTLEPIVENSPVSPYFTGTFSPNSPHLVLSDDGTMLIWNLEDLTLESVIDNGKAISGMTFSPSGRYLLTYSHDPFENEDEIILWDMTDIPIMSHQFTSFKDDLMVRRGVVTVSPDDSMLLILHKDFAVRTWDIETGELIAERYICTSK